MELRLAECSAESSRVTWSYATMYWGVSLYMAAHTISCLKWNIWVSSVLFECNDFWSKYSTRKFDKRVLTILLLKIMVAIFDLYRSWRQGRGRHSHQGGGQRSRRRRGEGLGRWPTSTTTSKIWLKKEYILISQAWFPGILWLRTKYDSDENEILSSS